MIAKTFAIDNVFSLGYNIEKNEDMLNGCKKKVFLIWKEYVQYKHACPIQFLK